MAAPGIRHGSLSEIPFFIKIILAFQTFDSLRQIGKLYLIFPILIPEIGCLGRYVGSPVRIQPCFYRPDISSRKVYRCDSLIFDFLAGIFQIFKCLRNLQIQVREDLLIVIDSPILCSRNGETIDNTIPFGKLIQKILVHIFKAWITGDIQEILFRQ